MQTLCNSQVSQRPFYILSSQFVLHCRRRKIYTFVKIDPVHENFKTPQVLGGVRLADKLLQCRSVGIACVYSKSVREG